jgi:hypothetical protein
MEYVYFDTVEERNAFLLDCLERGIYVRICYGNVLSGVEIDVEKTCLQKNNYCDMV